MAAGTAEIAPLLAKSSSDRKRKPSPRRASTARKRSVDVSRGTTYSPSGRRQWCRRGRRCRRGGRSSTQEQELVGLGSERETPEGLIRPGGSPHSTEADWGGRSLGGAKRGEVESPLRLGQRPNECDALANRASCEAHPVAHVNTRQGLPLDRAWSLMPRDYGCCGTEKPAKRGEVESPLRLGQRPRTGSYP